MSIVVNDISPGMKKEISVLHEGIGSIVINNDDSLMQASKYLGRVKTIAKELKATKKGILDPLSKSVRNIKALFVVPEQQLVDAELKLKTSIADYQNEKETRARLEADRIEHLASSTDKNGRSLMNVTTAMQKIANIDQAQSSIFTADGGMQMRQGQQMYRIVDVLALISDRPHLLERERVIDALRKEITADIKDGAVCPAGIEGYRNRVIAGITA